MKCYQITQGGECVALVAEIAMARAITDCQPPGYYQVEEVEFGEPISMRKVRTRKPSFNQHVGRGRRRPTKRPSRWLHIPAIVPIEIARPNAH
jgi:hypothetical protein